MGFCSIIIGILIVKLEVPIIIAILLTLLVGAGIASILGFIISYLETNPFIVTLAAWFILDSSKYLIGENKNISGFPKNFLEISTLKILHIPLIIIFSLLSLIVFDILLRKNVYFRKNYAIGGNEVAARLAGIKIKKNKFFNYLTVGLMAAVAAIFTTSRFTASILTFGQDNAFQVITAVIIGGASLKGGKGTILGTFLGLILMALIYNSIIFFNINIIWNKVVAGLVLIISVLIDVTAQKERIIKLRT